MFSNKLTKTWHVIVVWQKCTELSAMRLHKINNSEENISFKPRVLLSTVIMASSVLLQISFEIYNKHSIKQSFETN